MDQNFVLGGRYKNVKWFGEGEACDDLGAGSGADFDLPDLTYTLDVLVV